MPLVSVIIPNYNHAIFLKQRIDSVINQTFQDFEVIILDDCSTDDSRMVIEEYRSHPKISHIILNETNSGSTFKQWQKGIEFAKGDWVWIAESDDVADLTFLEELLLHSVEQNIHLIYSDSYSLDKNNKIGEIINWARCIDEKHWEKTFLEDGNEEIKNYLYCRNTIPNASAVLVKKVILKKVINELPFTFKYAGDWYIWIKSLENGKLVFVNKPLNYFRQHDKSSRTLKPIKEEKKRFFEYFYIINYVNHNFHIKLDYKKHAWIINEWQSKKFDKNKSFNQLVPPIPFEYYYPYYRQLIKKTILFLKRRI